MEKYEDKKDWTEPSVTELDVAEQTQSLPGDGPDGIVSDPEPS
jgi:hypothetical protein